MRKLLALVLLVSAASFAAERPSKAVKSAKDPRSTEAIATETEREFSIPVPQSEIKLEPLRYKPARPIELEISSSTWVPENLTRSSYTGQVSRFEKGDTPNLSVNFIKEAYSFGDMVLAAKIGATHFDMVRSSTRSVGVTGKQTLNFLMGRIGVESNWGNMLPWGIEPSLSFAVLPTWVNATKSLYEDDIGKFGWAYESTAGLLWRVNEGSRSDFGVVTLGLAGHAVTGTVAGSSLKGFGILGELRVSL